MFLTDIIQKLQHINKITENLEIVNCNLDQKRELNEILEKYLHIQNSIKIGRTYLNKLTPFIEKSIAINLIEDKIILLSRLTLNYKKIDEIKAEKTGINNDLSVNEKSIDSILYRYKDLLRKIEKCPFCLGDIKEDTINHIIKHHLGG